MSPPYNLVFENSMFKTSQEKDEILNDREKLVSLFFVNFFGMLGLFELKATPSRWTTYFTTDGKLQVKNMTDDNNDMSLVIKLMVDKGYLREAVANQLTRFLVKIKQKSIKQGELSDDILRGWLDNIMYGTYRPIPRIYAAIRKYHDKEYDLPQLGKALWIIVRSNAELKGLVSEFYEMGRLARPQMSKVDLKKGVAKNITTPAVTPTPVASIVTTPAFSPSYKIAPISLTTVAKPKPVPTYSNKPDPDVVVGPKYVFTPPVKERKARAPKVDHKALSIGEQYAFIMKSITAAQLKKNLELCGYADSDAVDMVAFNSWFSNQPNTMMVGENVIELSKWVITGGGFLAMELGADIVPIVTEAYRSFELKDIISLQSRKMLERIYIAMDSHWPTTIITASVEKMVEKLNITSKSDRSAFKIDLAQVDVTLSKINGIKNQDDYFTTYSKAEEFQDPKNYLRMILILASIGRTSNLQSDKIYTSVVKSIESFSGVTIDQDMWSKAQRVRIVGLEDYSSEYKELITGEEKERVYRNSRISLGDITANMAESMCHAIDTVGFGLKTFYMLGVDATKEFFIENYVYNLEDVVVNIIIHCAANGVGSYEKIIDTIFKAIKADDPYLSAQNAKLIANGAHNLTADCFKVIMNNRFSVGAYLVGRSGLQPTDYIKVVKALGIDLEAGLLEDLSSPRSEKTKIANLWANYISDVQVAKGNKLTDMIIRHIIPQGRKDISIPLIDNASNAGLLETLKYMALNYHSYNRGYLSNIRYIVGKIKQDINEDKEFLELLVNITKGDFRLSLAGLDDNNNPKLMIAILILKESGNVNLIDQEIKDNILAEYSKPNAKQIQRANEIDIVINLGLFKELMDNDKISAWVVLRDYYEETKLDSEGLVSTIKAFERELDGKPDDIELVLNTFKMLDNTEQGLIFGAVQDKDIKDSLVQAKTQEVFMSKSLEQLKTATIKPEMDVTTERMGKILQYNNINVDINPNYDPNQSLDSIVENLDVSVVSMRELAVDEEVMSEEDLELRSAEYDVMNHYKHGNIAVQFIKSYGVSLENQREEAKAFIEKLSAKDIPLNPMSKVFHGTGTVAASMILRYGFAVIDSGDPSVVGRMLGNGVYFSTVLDKVGQYVADEGYSRGIGNEGYILEMDAMLGERGENYAVAGLGGDNTKSPEWCVFEPNAQLNIYKAHKVRLVTKEEMQGLRSKYSLTEAESVVNIKTFKEFLVEATMSKYKNATTYIFRDGRIPVAPGKFVEFEQFKASQLGSNVTFDTSGQGPTLVVNHNEDKAEVFLVLDTEKFLRDKQKSNKFFNLIKK